MSNILKLDSPIRVNNELVSELAYDSIEITNDLYLEACMRSSRINNTMNGSALMELDGALHLCFGKAAIIAVNPSFTWETLNQLKGRDLLRVSNIGRFFITGRPDASAVKTSEKASVTTAEPSTQAPEISEE